MKENKLASLRVGFVLMLMFIVSEVAMASPAGETTTTTTSSTATKKPCPPCPVTEYYELYHTSHWHWPCTSHIHYMRKEYNQNPVTCKCYPKERELGVQCIGPLQWEVDPGENPRNPGGGMA